MMMIMMMIFCAFRVVVGKAQYLFGHQAMEGRTLIVVIVMDTC